MKYLNNIDLNKNQILNAILQNLGSAPSSPGSGQIYYNTTNNAAYVYNGTGWVSTDATKLSAVIPMSALVSDPLARANHTGTQAASTISDLATTVQAYTLNSFAAPSGNVPMGGYTLTGLNTNPNASGQAAEYSWVLNQLATATAGIKAIKDPVRAAIVVNVALTGIPTSGNADGLTLVDGDRVLLKGQSTAHENRIWIVHTGAWTAPTDFDQSSDITGGTEVLVNEGGVYAGSVWRLTTTGAITLATTSLSWAQVNQLNTYTNGNGLDLTGMVFSVKTPASGGITVDGTGVSVKLQTNSGLALAAGGLAVGAGTGITVGTNSVGIDTSVVARKYSVDVGDGSATSIVITHNLGTRDIQVTVRDIASYVAYEVDWAATTTNTATLTFAVAPAATSLRCTIVG